MQCPECNSHRKQWLGGNSFECRNCGWFYADPNLGASLQLAEKHKYEESIRCPVCDKLTEGIGDNLEHLENLHVYNNGFRDSKKWFHPNCWIEYQKNQENQRLTEHKQLSLLEKVSQVPCPHCGSLGIYLESDDYGYYDMLANPHWECFNCDKKIDKHWLMTQIRPERK